MKIFPYETFLSNRKTSLMNIELFKLKRERKNLNTIKNKIVSYVCKNY